MHTHPPCPAQALVDLVDRPARLTVDDPQRRLLFEANMPDDCGPQSTNFYVEGIVIAVDADARLRDGGSVIVRDDDDGYRIIGLAHVENVRLVEAVTA
jgi:hypothetical protein